MEISQLSKLPVWCTVHKFSVRQYVLNCHVFLHTASRCSSINFLIAWFSSYSVNNNTLFKLPTDWRQIIWLCKRAKKHSAVPCTEHKSIQCQDGRFEPGTSPAFVLRTYLAGLDYISNLLVFFPQAWEESLTTSHCFTKAGFPKWWNKSRKWESRKIIR